MTVRLVDHYRAIVMDLARALESSGDSTLIEDGQRLRHAADRLAERFAEVDPLLLSRKGIHKRQSQAPQRTDR